MSKPPVTRDHLIFLADDTADIMLEDTPSGPLATLTNAGEIVDVILEALTEPSDEMENSGQEEFERLGSDACRVWRVMVKAI